MGNDFRLPNGHRSAVVMPRPPGIQFAGANYHIVPRGDGRQKLLHDDGHYGRFTNGLQPAFGGTPPTAGARGCSIDCGASTDTEVPEGLARVVCPRRARPAAVFLCPRCTPPMQVQ